MSKQKQVSFKVVNLILNLGICIFEIIGLVMSFNKHGLNFLIFYTEDSNFLALVVSLLTFIYVIIGFVKNRYVFPKWLTSLRYMTTCCLVVTFLVVLFALAPVNGMQGYYHLLFTGSNFYHHLVCPLLMTVSFFYFDRERFISMKLAFISLVPTIIYGIVLLILNLCRVVDGPYPFFRIYNQSILMSIVLFAMIFVAAFLVSITIRFLYNFIRRKLRKVIKK